MLANIQNNFLVCGSRPTATICSNQHRAVDAAVWPYSALLRKFLTLKFHLINNVHQIVAAVRKKIGPFAQPDFIQEAPGLPKTRSGKIMRRVLRKIAVNDRDLGDISTMADESVVDMLFRLRPANA